MGQEDHHDMTPQRALPSEPRPDAVARGQARLRSGPVASDALAAVMLEAHDLLRTVHGRRTLRG